MKVKKKSDVEKMHKNIIKETKSFGLQTNLRRSRSFVGKIAEVY